MSDPENVLPDTAPGHDPPGHAAPVRSPIAAAPVRPPELGPTDPDLLAAIEAALAAEGRIDRALIAVAVAQGAVRLSGRVPTEFQRQLAVAVAGAVPGVLVVNDHLDALETGEGL